MTVKQIILGLTAAGVTFGLLLHRMPDGKSTKSLLMAKKHVTKHLAKKSNSASAPTVRKPRSDQGFKSARA